MKERKGMDKEAKEVVSDELKKDCKIKISIKDLGMAAFMKCQGWNLYRKEGRNFVFLIESAEEDAFASDRVSDINGPFAKFDAAIMQLKALS